MMEFRAEFDAELSFSNGGRLATQGFRIDVPGPLVGEATITELFLTSLGLLMVERVELQHITIFPEAHKGTRGGPSDKARPTRSTGVANWRHIELSHVIT